MKTMKIIIGLFSIFISIIFINTSLAMSTVNINILSLIPQDQVKKLSNSNNDELRVLNLKEDVNSYYFMIGSTNKGIGVIKSPKNNIYNSIVYSIFDGQIPEKYIIDFSIGDDGSIWLEQCDDDGYITRISVDDEVSKVRFKGMFSGVQTGGKAAWREDDNTLKIWDGKETFSFEISSKDTVDIAIYKNDLVYINKNFEIYRVSNEGIEKLAVLSVPETSNTYKQKLLTLWSNNETLWAVISYSKLAIDSQQSEYEVSDGRLINVTKNKVYNVDMENILKAVCNSDGSFYFLARPYMPFIPVHPLPDNICEVTVNKDGDLNYNSVECENWQDIKQSYLDMQGNTWLYNLFGKENGTIKNTADGTTTNYYFNNSMDMKPEISVSINDINVEFDVAPCVEKQRVLVPLRGFANIIGATVEWIKKENKIIIDKQGNIIELTIGSCKAFVNGREVSLDVPAEVKNGRTMVPIRFISESFFADVKWDGILKTVIINTSTE